MSKFIFVLVLFMISLPSQSQVIMQDKVIFKVAQTVFSLNDLKSYYDDLANMKCIYNESLLVKIFEKEFSLDQKDNFIFNVKLSEKQKDYFLDLIDFAKLLVYSKSQNVVVEKSIVKYFYFTAKKLNCSLKSFNEDGTPKASMEEMIRFEVFVRSRFLPSEKNGKSTKDDISKAVVTAKNLIKSIGRQVEEEIYW